MKTKALKKQLFLIKKTISLLTITLLFFLSMSTNTTGLFGSVQVGEPILETIETPHPYNGGEGIVFERTFSYPGAGYISIHFAKFDLAPGDYLEISSPDGKYSYVYRERGKAVADGSIITTFWATHIPGDTAVVKLCSRNPKGAWGIEIDKWVRGYEAEYIDALLTGIEDLEMDAQIESICGEDGKKEAKCYMDTRTYSKIYEKSRTVARLLINGSDGGTGWLLGSEGHLVTNNHCIKSQSDADNTDYEFMAEGSACSSDCSGSMECPGTVEATSGTLVKTNPNLDYSLILLPGHLAGTYGYLQLRDTPPNINERIYIPQHPYGWGKQVAVHTDKSKNYFTKISSLNEPQCEGNPIDIGYDADTSVGSSGSPVIAYNGHLVVALHHCGGCPNRGVPIPPIISDIYSVLPNNAISSIYCASSGNTQSYEWIAGVKMVVMGNTFENNSGPYPYSCFTNITFNLTKGKYVNVTLTPGYSGYNYREYWRIWIDYNRDGDFNDNGELEFSGSGSSLVTGGFTVNNTGPSHFTTRMRISMKYGDYAGNCVIFYYGEVEDYTVSISNYF